VHAQQRNQTVVLFGVSVAKGRDHYWYGQETLTLRIVTLARYASDPPRHDPEASSSYDSMGRSSLTFVPRHGLRVHAQTQ
jgi:hypothetical protein